MLALIAKTMPCHRQWAAQTILSQVASEHSPFKHISPIILFHRISFFIEFHRILIFIILYLQVCLLLSVCLTYFTAVQVCLRLTNLDSVLKSRDVIFPTKVRIVRAMVFPAIIYGYESWTIKKAECQTIDSFELWCWRRLLRIPWKAKRSNQ